MKEGKSMRFQLQHQRVANPTQKTKAKHRKSYSDPEDSDVPVEPFDSEELFITNDLSREAKRDFERGQITVKTPLGHKALISLRELETSRKCKGQTFWRL